MPIGIMTQLPSSHLSIHRVPAKFSNGVMPHGEYYRWLRLFFVVELLLTRLPFNCTDKSASAMPPLFYLASRYCCRRIYAIIYGFLLQSPAQPPALYGGSAGLWKKFFRVDNSYLCCLCCCRSLMPDIFQQPCRIYRMVSA